MNISKFCIAGAVAAAALHCASVQANVVTFDDVTNHSATPFDSGGLHFVGNNTYVWQGDGAHSDNGTVSLISASSASFTITKTGGGLFSIDELDAGLSWYTALTSLVVTVGSESITLSQNYQTFSLSSLQNISSVTIGLAPADGYYAFDNIVWHDDSRVPEPASFPLVGAALLAVGAARRRRA
jgi:hypothetical protein